MGALVIIALLFIWLRNQPDQPRYAWWNTWQRMKETKHES